MVVSVAERVGLVLLKGKSAVGHGLVTIGGDSSGGLRWRCLLIALEAFAIDFDVVFLHVVGNGEYVARVAAHRIAKLLALVNVL